MRRSAVMFAAFLMMVLIPGPAQAASVSMVGSSLASFAFSPKSVATAQGSTVSWHNASITTHTSTQNAPLSLWNTGNVGVNTTSSSITLRAAGSYPYHCSIHTFMTGMVKVPILVSPTTGTASTTFTITLTSATQSGFTYDIEKKVGGGSFMIWHTGVTTRTVRFTGSAGTYAFRSRLHKTSNGATSGWSPAKTITIS